MRVFGIITVWAALIACGGCSRQTVPLDDWKLDHEVAGLTEIRLMSTSEAEVQVNGQWMSATWTEVKGPTARAQGLIGIQGHNGLNYSWIVREDIEGKLRVQDDRGFLHPLWGPRLAVPNS